MSEDFKWWLNCMGMIVITTVVLNVVFLWSLPWILPSIILFEIAMFGTLAALAIPSISYKHCRQSDGKP